MGKWEMVRLGDAATINMGQSPPSNTYNDIGDGLPFFQGKTDFGLTNPKIRVFCNAPQKIAKEKDILISVRAPVGAVNIASQKCCIGRGLAAISEKDHIYHKYLYYFLKYKESEIENMGVGSTFKAISRKDLDTIQIPLPPLPIQQKIADVLDRASTLIEKRKAQIEKLDVLVKSRFVEMFGDPVTNPMGWEIKKLGKLCEIYRGGSPRPIEKFLGGTIPWIKIGDATIYGSDVYLYQTKEHIIESGIHKSRFVRHGSLIFANCGVSLGFARIIQFDGCIHDGWLSFENIDSAIDKIFLLKSINHCTNYFRKTAPDGTQPNLNTGIMKEFQQIIPPLAIQNQFSTFAQHVESQKTRIKKSLELFELNYKSLMQKCFNGEIY